MHSSQEGYLREYSLVLRRALHQRQYEDSCHDFPYLNVEFT